MRVLKKRNSIPKTGEPKWIIFRIRHWERFHVHCHHRMCKVTSSFVNILKFVNECSTPWLWCLMYHSFCTEWITVILYSIVSHFIYLFCVSIDICSICCAWVFCKSFVKNALLHFDGFANVLWKPSGASIAVFHAYPYVFGTFLHFMLISFYHSHFIKEVIKKYLYIFSWNRR